MKSKNHDAILVNASPPRTSSFPLGPNIPRSPPILEPPHTMFFPYSTRHQVIMATHNYK